MHLNWIACRNVGLCVVLSLVMLAALTGCPEKRSSTTRPGVKSVFGPGPNLVDDTPATTQTQTQTPAPQSQPAQTSDTATDGASTAAPTSTRPGVKSLFGPGPTLIDPEPQPDTVTPTPTPTPANPQPPNTPPAAAAQTRVDPVDGPVITTHTASEITTNLTITTDEPGIPERSFSYKAIRTLDTRRNRQIQQRRQGMPTRWLEVLRSHQGRAVTKSSQSPMDIKPMPDPLLDAPMQIQIIHGRVQAALSSGSPTPAQTQALQQRSGTLAAFDATFADGPRSPSETWTVNRSTLRTDNLMPEFVADRAVTVNRYLRDRRFEGRSCAMIQRTVTINGRYRIDGTTTIPATLTLEGQCYIALNDGLVVKAVYQLSLTGGGDVTMDSLRVKTQLDGEGVITVREVNP